MPKISLIPTQKVVIMAEEKGMRPEKYIGGIAKTLIPYDLRYKDENGQFLQDIKITRDDGSSFSIHEIESECADLDKFIISDYRRTGVKKFYAYTQNLDMVKLQNDKKYLYAFSEVLCSKNRIREKQQLSLKNDNTEYIYLGGLRYSNEANGYVKVAKDYNEIQEQIYLKRYGLDNEHDYKKEKSTLVWDINEKLNELSITQLRKISKELEKYE